MPLAVKQSWLESAKKGDLVFVCAHKNYIPSEITRATKLTLYVRKMKFRRRDGSLMWHRGAIMSMRAAAQFRIVERKCCE